MPNGFLNISHNFAGDLQFIICEWVKSTAQGTPVVGHVTGTGLGAQNDTDVTQVFYPSPHVNEQLQVINISEQWHLVRFWRSADGISKDVLLLELAGNARTGALFPIQRFEYVVDRGQFEAGVWADPIDGDKGLRDTRLFEKAYWVEERGTASLLSTEIIDKSDEGGGFDFVDVNKFMNSGGVYVVYVINKVTQGGDDDSGLITTDDNIYMLTSDQIYDPVTMGGRTIIANFSTAIGQLDMGPLNVAPDSRFKLQTHTGVQRNVILQLSPGNVVIFRKQAVNSIILGEGEEIEILIKDNIMYILNHQTNHARLGELSWCYKEMMNGLKADGALLALVNYPRVAELINGLPVTAIVNETAWQTFIVVDGANVYFNKGKWMSDGTNFRTPDLRGMIAKGLEGVETPGRYEHRSILQHHHLFGAGNDDGGVPYVSESHGTGGNSSYTLHGSSSAPSHYETGNVAGVTAVANNLVNNVGLYPIILI